MKRTLPLGTVILAAFVLTLTSCYSVAGANPVNIASRVTDGFSIPLNVLLSPGYRISASSIDNQALTNRPNIVFVLTDDLDRESIKVMSKLKTLLIEQGTIFSNSFLNMSLCCPSRTTILRGQYATNTQVYGNTPPDGGFGKVFSQALEKSTIAVWLQSSGYQTMLAGKYLNGFPDKRDPMYIPPGWDEWYSAVKGNAYSEFSYVLNENGKTKVYGKRPRDYGTDVYTERSVDFIRRASSEGKPFFVYLAPYAPHGPATPAPRHESLFPDATAPRTPNYNETDVSDKPSYIRRRPELTPKQMNQIDADYRKRLQSLMAVDDALGKIVDALKEAKQLDNTFIFFTSDNGFHLGNHRLLEGKVAPYEEDIRVPLIIRGPGVPSNRTLEHLVGNVDFAPTFAALAGVSAPDFVDGRSLVPLLSATPLPPESWRQSYLIQNGSPRTTASLGFLELDSHASSFSPADPELLEPADMDDLDVNLQLAGGIPPFFGIRTKDYVYVEYATGERELYDLRSDPYELVNIATTASPEITRELSEKLAKLRRCSGEACRTADR